MIFFINYIQTYSTLSINKMLVILLTSWGVTFFIGVNFPIFNLNESQVLYIYSTSSQVLAGIYGLTLTGFIFRRNELSRREIEDESLSDAIDNIKERQFNTLTFVSLMSLVTLILSNVALASDMGRNSKLYIFILNSAQSSFFLTLIFITFFIFDVLSPKEIENESKSLQKELDEINDGTETGSLEEFIRNYNNIEEIMQSISGKHYFRTVVSVTSYPTNKRVSNSKLAKLIRDLNFINDDEYGRIRNLITLRNSIIHGANPVVSKKMVKESEEIKKILDSKMREINERI